MRPPPPPDEPVADPPRVRWQVARDTATASEFHRRDPETDTGHQLWIQRIPGPALILGSTQPDELIRADRAEADGIEICRRRSGGGLVFLDPATDCWLDAIVPAGSPLWHDDVGVAFHWLGNRWAAALNDLLGPAGPALANHPRAGATQRRRPLWCFAGLGHGEVTIGASKVVGLSQRRTRQWIRLQSLVLGAWPGRRLLPYLDLDVARALAETGPSGRSLTTAARAAGLLAAESARADRGDQSPPLGTDPGRVRAGPPPGIRLPAPDVLVEAFLERTRRAGPGEPPS
jgi:hypothetical protein